MALRWEDERYVRLYTRDTTTWKLLPWQAKCLLPLLLRKLDRAGLAEVGDPAEEGIAALTDMPLDLVHAALPALLARKVFVLNEGVLAMPNFDSAQTAKQSDRARQAARRERDRLDAMGVTQRDEVSHGVTDRHEESRGVTDSHAASRDVTPSLAEPSRTDLTGPAAHVGVVPSSSSPDRPPNPPDPSSAEGSTRARGRADSGQPICTPGLQTELLPAAAPQKAPQRPASGPAPEAPTTPVWTAYAGAYRARWGTEPVRNQQVNSQLAQLVRHLGAQEAAAVAAHFLTDTSAFYVAQRHPIGLLLRDYQKLRAEWVTGTHTNMTAARQQERTAANPALQVLAEQRARRERGTS